MFEAQVAVTKANARAGPVARPMVTPFARALAVLEAFAPGDRWLGNRELADRTGLPASTVARMAQSLFNLGYLHKDADVHKFRLAPAVLALGYAAVVNTDRRHTARWQMQGFSAAHGLDTALWLRDRLELTVVEGHASVPGQLPADLRVGARSGIACSPFGWALLAVLPELERYYLMDRMEQNADRKWPLERRRLCEAVSQVKEVGYCLSIGEWSEDMAVIAVPILIEGQGPVVLSCVGRSGQITRARAQRELAPRLMAAASAIGHAALLT